VVTTFISYKVREQSPVGLAVKILHEGSPDSPKTYDRIVLYFLFLLAFSNYGSCFFY